MEKVNIILHPNVTDFFEELITVLYQKNYFGFENEAQNYVQKIYDFIEYNLPIFPSKKTPENLSNLGSNYIFYKANQNTTWYIFLKTSKIDILSLLSLIIYSEIVQFL